MVKADRVVIVDDHRVVGESLRRALDREPDFEVVGCAATATEGVDLALLLEPDLVVMDYGLPDGTGARAAEAIRTARPGVTVVVLTARPTAERLQESLDAGCAGFVGKGQPFAEVLDALRAPRTGGLRVPAHLTFEAFRHVSRLGGPPELSGREREVLRLLATGASTGDIASALCLSIFTVRNHVRNALRKLGARTRIEGVAVARHWGMIDDDPVPAARRR